MDFHCFDSNVQKELGTFIDKKVGASLYLKVANVCVQVHLLYFVPDYISLFQWLLNIRLFFDLIN